MSDLGPKLTPEQIEEIKKETIQKGIPVRFLFNGRNLNITNGKLLPKGINVFYQVVYWNFTKETSKKIANWLGCKAIFSEG